MFSQKAANIWPRTLQMVCCVYLWLVSSLNLGLDPSMRYKYDNKRSIMIIVKCYDAV